MMTRTYQALGDIPDTKFEHLAACFVRRTKSGCSALKETGVNHAGKTIPCPVDAFAFIEGDPPRWIGVAATVTARKELRGKWMGTKTKNTNKNKIGDIDNALREFRAWQQDYPSARGTLYLCWNQSLEHPDLERDVKRYGSELGVTVEVVEATQIIDYLDHTAEGQYLREDILEIKAARLSESLLRKLAGESLDRHHMAYPAELPAGGHEIARDVEEELVISLTLGSAGIVGLRGPSGAGKSVLIRRLGRRVNEDGGIALWVPAENVTPNLNAASILLVTLKHFHPSLNDEAGEEALRLAGSIHGGITLLVDDVNDTAVPPRTVSALRTLVAAGSAAHSPSVHVVVPLWPGLLRLPGDTREDTSSSYVDLGRFSFQERMRLATTRDKHADVAMREVYDSLDGDPFLCGHASATAVAAIASGRCALILAQLCRRLRRAEGSSNSLWPLCADTADL